MACSTHKTLTMKTIYFDSLDILHMYMFPLSKLYYFKPGIIVNNQLETRVYESNSLRLVLSNHIYGGPNRHPIKYNKNHFYILDRSNIFAGRKDENEHNMGVFLQLLEENLKVFIVDIEGEPLFLKDDSLPLSDFLEIIDSHENCEMITSRDFDFKYNGIHVNEILLPVLGFYFKLHDNLYTHPTLPTFEYKQKKYDFISYIGLEPSINRSKNWRRYVLSKIQFLDKSIFLPNSFDFDLHYIKKLVGVESPNLGSYNWFSVLESEQAKIKLVFETVDPFDRYEKYNNFLTEKTLKCFIHSQPYFIVMTERNKILLKKLGFLFPEPGGTFEEQINYINNICEGDLDTWIDDNKHIFRHNKELFNDIIFSTDTVLIKTFLKFTNTLER